jgi:hypothetical protein
MNKREATERWVGQFNAVRTDMLRDLDNCGCGNIVKLTGGISDYSGDIFPSWGWMWQFASDLDDEWLARHVEDVAKIGFDVFDTDYGYYLGIDAGGFDFYEAFWVPLYELRGLQWHDKEDK